MSDRESIFYTRVTVVGIGLFLLIWGIWYELPDSVWTYMGVTGTVYVSGAVTALIGGMYWKRASNTGAAWAMCGSLFAIAGLFDKPLHEFAERRAGANVAAFVSSESIGLFVYVLCLCLFVAGSLLFPNQEKPSNQELSP